MVNELKVYNRFGELTLHLRHSLGPNPELLTIDGTEDMRAAVAQLKGNDFDRTIAKGNELVRLTADWGSPQYLSILAQYLGMNFGWRTQIIETEQRASMIYKPAEVTDVSRNDPFSRYSGNTMLVITNVSEYRPDLKLQIEFRRMPTIPEQERERNVYGIAAS
jgi:hypothetical protein